MARRLGRTGSIIFLQLIEGMNDTRSWLVTGAILTLLASAIAPLTDNVTPLIPLPVHTYVLFAFIGYGYLIFLPATFVATFGTLWKRPWFGVYGLAAAVVLAMLDAYWWVAQWSAGLASQGRPFTLAVATENVVGFSAVLLLALFGERTRSKRLQAWAYVVLFMLLGWCAFPLLGDYAG